MLKNASTVCLRCRLALAQNSKANDPSKHVQHIAKRFRGKLAEKPSWTDKQKFTGKPRYTQFSNTHRARPASPFREPAHAHSVGTPPKDLTPDKCGAYFETAVKNWTTSPRTLQRFQRFGFAPKVIQPLLDAYAQVGMDGFFSTPENQAKYQLSRFTDYASSKPMTRQLDAEVTFSTVFFSWALHTKDSAILDTLAEAGKIDAGTLAAVRHLADVARRRPAEEFPATRKMRRRIIMHVGPTNSGKTHHALRALAAAKTGVYAGPLRLLAHEIWERLNLGQIVPLGVEQPPPNSLPSSSSTSTPPPSLPSLSSSTNSGSTGPPAQPQPHRDFNPDYARPTNMITGEEKKIVSEHAGLLACTVEMLSYRALYDVGVIDEIQMIGDPQRGFAWTTAVLGLCAKEVHLCGEESAIPIIKELLKETGDTLEVRRYERLTPLSVEKQSLGDYSKVQRGDCVVAFSRTRIFEIKEEIERRSGMRCAVVYGKLPPEIRSEQAALFNDPHSGYDVIIGSDAIGMGLNLKIRRIIFDSVHKSDGVQLLWPLSISQAKQIAGRAGRYGHSIAGSESKPGGFTTTLHAKDLPFIQSALAHPSTPTLTNAHIGSTIETFSKIVTALPANTPLESVQMAHIYASSLPSRVYRYVVPSKVADICAWVDEKGKGQLTWAEKQMLVVSPVAWKDEQVLGAAEEMVKMQRDEMCVRVERVVEKLGCLDALMWVERGMEKLERANASAGEKGEGKMVVEVKEGILESLESFHKVLVLYMWMHYRNTVVYPEREEAEKLKLRVEVALEWALRQLGRRDVAREWVEEQRAQSKTSKKRAPVWSDSRKRIDLDVDAEEEFAQEVSLVLGRVNRLSPRPNSSPQTRRDAEHASAPTREKQKIGYSTSGGDRAVRWEQPPDLSTLLKRYVDAPSLKVGDGGSRVRK
ncbi:hypothetical protein P691DRAFT_779350 [Macrolepiota fuliginosa MF-IS2]|uniref:Helicase C-terminal domain-containing protein n=1 Tax=Macrolepiota fuliginosa MF-IS2 TaxID=1400762 RepID=A0A9P6BYL1_9AGAR|nr:hypothetical protein P691DRAFT_779350 [Macrolepiota fuliginosa MF-IS2]